MKEVTKIYYNEELDCLCLIQGSSKFAITSYDGVSWYVILGEKSPSFFKKNTYVGEL